MKKTIAITAWWNIACLWLRGRWKFYNIHMIRSSSSIQWLLIRGSDWIYDSLLICTKLQQENAGIHFKNQRNLFECNASSMWENHCAISGNGGGASAGVGTFGTKRGQKYWDLLSTPTPSSKLCWNIEIYGKCPLLRHLAKKSFLVKFLSFIFSCTKFTFNLWASPVEKSWKWPSCIRNWVQFNI